jgi:hypothetical protein
MQGMDSVIVAEQRLIVLRCRCLCLIGDLGPSRDCRVEAPFAIARQRSATVLSRCRRTMLRCFTLA